MVRYANTHVSPNLIEFVGQGWEDAGYRVNEDGAPTHDARGNTVAKHGEREIEVADAALLIEAYAGDSGVEDWDDFQGWAVREAGASEAVANEIAKLQQA